MLEIELVPSTAWGQNARTLLTSTEWDTLRRYVFRRAGNKCQLCGGVGPKHPVEGHEVWHWDESSAMQYLDGIQALCPWCHRCKHWGRTSKQGLEAQAMRHLAKVNNWDPIQVIDHVSDAKLAWRRRSAIAWTLDDAGIRAMLAAARRAKASAKAVA